jgi:phosphohistidine phosphatase
MRHAKAEPFAETDHARILTDRGAASARDVGRHLRETGVTAEHALVSTATRTRQTWEAVAHSAGLDGVEARFEDAVFSGSPDLVLELLRAAPADAGVVLLVGHNPTAAYLCHLLDNGEGETAAVSAMLHGFPPGAVAVLEIEVPWAELGPESGRVVDFYVGG